jgi:hypothetical protein
MRVIGWLCVVGIAAVIVEMVMVLPYLPESWWTPPEQLRLPPGHFDLRGAGVMHPGLIGWFGAWGYLASWVWLPLAGWRAIQAARGGQASSSEERVLLALVSTLLVVLQALLRLTPLKYEYPLV